MNYESVFDESTIKAIKSLTNGMVITEISKEFVLDEEGKMKLVKKKINKKTLPPNTDIVKMIYSSSKDDNNVYKDMTDEDLEKEKERLLKMLCRENQNGDRKNNNKNQM